MMTYAVQVSNIAPTTTREHLHDFFTFCGKIDTIELKEEGDSKHQSATIYFEKGSAARTALMLNGGTLDGSNLTVTSTELHPDGEPAGEGSGEHHIGQEDKPRSGIVAEYLAKGYVLSDSILHRAIEMDKKQGISTRFLAYIRNLDAQLGKKVAGQPEEGTLSEKVQSRAKTLDEQHGVTTKATSYYERALSSPLGQRVFAFYSTTSKQVLDIHEEARRIAEQQKAGASTTSPTSPTTAAAESSKSG
ncbi:hypothetical protein FRC03_008420 [Tulasnella sp. 419]|nr:hypothetical protein FRC03_008420 [Tulasnella sp. 419]